MYEQICILISPHVPNIMDDISNWKIGGIRQEALQPEIIILAKFVFHIIIIVLITNIKKHFLLDFIKVSWLRGPFCCVNSL